VCVCVCVATKLMHKKKAFPCSGQVALVECRLLDQKGQMFESIPRHLGAFLEVTEMKLPSVGLIIKGTFFFFAVSVV
jgi:hypothetical protein